MRSVVALLCPAVLTFALMQTASGQQVNGRVETLKNGDQVFVPKGMTMIPGVPVVLSDRDLKRVATARQQLESLGYVDRPNDTSFAFNALRFSRAQLKRQQSGNAYTATVFKAAEFDFSNTDAGRVSPEILSDGSEAYVLVSPIELTRVYSNTKFGDVYINEMRSATLGVIGNSGAPSISIAGHRGYVTTVRYSQGQLATLILLPTARGVAFVEIGRTYDRSKAAELDQFLTGLVTDRQD